MNRFSRATFPVLFRLPLAAAGLLALVFALFLSPSPALEANSPPATPASVTVTRSGNTLNVTYDNPAGATKYHVTYSDDNGNSWASAGDNLTAGGVTFGGTDPTKTYIAAVRAGNDHGWSGWRNSAPIAPDGSTAPPAAPGTINITRSDGSMTVAWSEPASANKYHVTYSSNNGGSWSAPSCGDNCSNAVNISVDNAKTYIVAVRAGNDSGWSGWTQSAASGPFGPVAPPTPGPITVTRTDGQLTATWDAVSGADYYHINYSSDNKNSWQSFSDQYNQLTITRNVDNNKTYYIAIRAGTASGNETLWSGWRTSAASEPFGQPPATPASVSVSRGNGTLSVSGYGVDDATKYHVTYSSNNGGSWNAAPCGDNCSDNVTINNVDNQKTYIVAVRAGNNGGWSGWRNSAAIGPSNPPAAPSDITVIRVCDSRFEMAWPAVSGATGYDVNFSNNNGKSWQRTLSNVSVLAWKFNQWHKNKTYIFAVRARNSAGESGWTNSAASPPPPCRPDTISAVTSTTHGTAGGSITATWSAGKRASAYNVNYRPAGGNWQRIQTGVTGTTHTGTVSSTGGYTVSVQSTNGHGMSQWRSAGASTWLTASNVTGTGADLDLSGHSGNWWYQANTGPDSSCRGPFNYTDETLGRLAGSTTYTYTAYSDASCTSPMARASFTTSAALTASNITATGATLTIAGRSGNWYYERLKISDNTWGCSNNAVNSTSATLSGLDASTQYVYYAHAASGCEDIRLLMTSFQTRASGDSFSFTNVTQITMDATFHQQNPSNWWFQITRGGNNWGSCQSGSSNLSFYAMSADTTYTFTAYSDSGCTTQVASDSVKTLPAGKLTYVDVLQTSAELRLDFHTGDWWYQANTGPHTTCAKAGGSTITVTGLTMENAYTYTAYSDSTCSTQLGSVGITTLGITLTVDNIKAREAKLNIAGHTAQWYYKADKAPDNTCQGPVSANDSTDDLNGLSPGTAYVYTAYSDSGCSTTLATASSFTTEISLDVYNVTYHATTLRLHGWNAQWWHKITAGTPADNTCQGPVAAGGDGSTGGLNHSNQYTVRAYSASGCAAANEIAVRVFNTPAPGS